MEKLIIINFEKDPDQFYNVLELQETLDKNYEKRYLVIAYRKDGATDVYYQSMFPFASQANVLNNINYFESALEGTIFEQDEDRLEVFFDFRDRYGRQVKVKITENNIRNKKPFFLLAPVGVISKNPISLPVYSLYKMSLPRKKHTDIEIVIGKVKHRPDIFPLPIDWSVNYFIRYSTDTFMVDWNKSFAGSISPLTPTKNEVEANGLSYDLIDNDGHYEIRRMSSKGRRHKIIIDFFSPVPDIASLVDDIHINGNFSITTDNSTGVISGEYFLEKPGDEVQLKFHPKGGWNPNEKRLVLKILFMIVKIFKNWPKGYVWNAKIIMEETNDVRIKSGWVRV